MCIKFKIIELINKLLCIIGYIRIYDIQNQNEITLLYFLLKIIEKYLPFKIDISYSKIGVCKYINNKYVRYICYDCKLTDINNTNIRLSSKIYHNITKIQLLSNTREFIYDLTNSKLNFYDTNYFSELSNKTLHLNKTTNQILNNMDTLPIKQTYIFDVIIFYLLLSKKNVLKDTNIVILTREYIDDDTFEHQIIHEEIQFTDKTQSNI
jgi:hypothetical protein